MSEGGQKGPRARGAVRERKRERARGAVRELERERARGAVLHRHSGCMLTVRQCSSRAFSLSMPLVACLKAPLS